MSKYISIHLIIFYYLTIIISTFCSATSFSTCPLQSTLFLNSLRSQSPLSFIPTPPLQVGGEFLETALNSKDVNTYTSVLFYASWCPFSNDVLPTFEDLSSMFPQITHVAVEESSLMPSILSRYGIHSFPAILIVKHASQVRFHGRKDLHSLLKFYKKTTGLEPMHYVAVDEPASLKCSREFVMQSWVGSSPTEVLRKEPYLVLSLLFLCLVGFTYTFPRVVSHFKALWVSYGPHLNLEIFGETSQILGRLLQMVDVNRIWTKLKLCQTRRFISGAKNARGWASSLASVSLGMEPEHTKQQETNIRDDCQHSNGLKETKGANIWRKRTLGGLLAICSFAAAAAIICIVILGKRWPHQRLHFRIYRAREQEERNGAKSSNIMKQCQQQPEEIPRSPT